jgi:hypothetical protein
MNSISILTTRNALLIFKSLFLASFMFNCQGSGTSSGSSSEDGTQEPENGNVLTAEERLGFYENEPDYVMAATSEDPLIDFYITPSENEYGRYDIAWDPLENRFVFGMTDAFVEMSNLRDLNDSISTWELKFLETDMGNQASHLVIGLKSGERVNTPQIEYIKGKMDEMDVYMEPEHFIYKMSYNAITHTGLDYDQIILKTYFVSKRHLDGFLDFWQSFVDAIYYHDSDALKVMLRDTIQIMGTTDGQFMDVTDKQQALFYLDEMIKYETGSYMVGNGSVDPIRSYLERQNITVILNEKWATAGSFEFGFDGNEWGVSRLSFPRKYEDYDSIIASVESSTGAYVAASDISFMPDLSTITFRDEEAEYSFKMSLVPDNLKDLEIYDSFTPEGSAFPEWTLNDEARRKGRYLIYFDTIDYVMPLSNETIRAARLKKIIDTDNLMPGQ